MTAPSRICMCGFMGAGKSSAGAALALRLTFRFADLDAEIEAEYGLAVHQIFRQVGEDAFREAETVHGERLLEQKNLVLALGGGALTSEALQKAVSKRAFLVYLKASPETLYDRIRHEDHRPLLEGVGEYADFLKVYANQMDRRREGYQRAALTVSTDGLNVAGIVDYIMGAFE